MGAESGMAASSGGKAVSSMLGAWSESEAIKMQGEFQQSQYEFNRKIGEYKAEEAIKMGEEEVTRHKRQVKQMIGSQRVALAAQGIEIESGSALDIQAETAMLGAMDEITIRNNALRSALGYKMGALKQGFLGRYAGISSESRAMQTLLAGGQRAASSAGSAYSSYNGSVSEANKEEGREAARNYWK